MKRLLPIVLLLLLSSITFAQSKHRFELGIGGMYSYNHTLSHHGGGNFGFDYRYDKYFNGKFITELHSPGYARVTLRAIPILPIKHGEFFADVAGHCTFAWVNSIAKTSAALSVGYRMDYLSLQVGIMTHCFIDMNSHSRIWEPVDLLYHLGVECRPHDNPWNIGIGCANFNDFEYVRWFDPIFYINGNATVYKNLKWFMRVDLKPAGSLNLTAQFWGVSVRTGLKYTF